MEYISLNIKLKTWFGVPVKKEVKTCKNMGNFNHLI
jgi:hypothetical protein